MCGIVGLLSPKSPVDARLIRAMTERIIPRGPDSTGTWVAEGGRIGLGHRRLAIIDLSEAGHQPMTSAGGRYVITYNGEIYNFAELRADLESAGRAPSWRGHSDTEVMLAVFDAYGVREGITRLSGMFALAVWDRQRRELVLARDRFGEKPLYYGWTTSGFAFASTLAPIAATPGFANPIDSVALSCLMSRAYVPAPLSIHKGIFKVEPGCLVTLSGDAAFGTSPVSERYFDYAEQVLAGAANPITNRTAALDELDAVLTEAVGRQLVADVPVGTFLSGGIDSSLITAIAQKCVDRPIRTFTIGFDENGFDEAIFARRVAAALGTEHTELYVTPADALAVIPELPRMFDEPFGDSSQIPTYLVSKLARQQVTVSLSGDAGDELFGGYNRHIQFPRVWRRLDAFPGPLRRGVLGVVRRVPPAAWNGLIKLAGGRPEAFGFSVQRGFAAMAQAGDFGALFNGFLDGWSGRSSPLLDKSLKARALLIDPRMNGLPLEMQMMFADATSYLPDDILVKVDRAGMAVSLESRIPFLDPQVTALAARIDPALKFARGGGKDILKHLLYRYVPRDLVDRPKAGFAIPVGEWLRSDLRDWAESLLSVEALRDGGLLDAAVIRSRWSAHLTGREDATQPLWSVLMFQAWRQARD